MSSVNLSPSARTSQTTKVEAAETAPSIGAATAPSTAAVPAQPVALIDPTPAGAARFHPAAGGGRLLTPQSVADLLGPTSANDSRDVRHESVRMQDGGAQAVVQGDTVEIWAGAHGIDIQNIGYSAPGSTSPQAFPADSTAFAFDGTKLRIDTKALPPGTYRLELESYVNALAGQAPLERAVMELVVRSPAVDGVVADTYGKLHNLLRFSGRTFEPEDIAGSSFHPLADHRAADGPLLEVALSADGRRAYVIAIATSEPFGPLLPKDQWKKTYYGPFVVPAPGGSVVGAELDATAPVRVRAGDVVQIVGPRAPDNQLVERGATTEDGRLIYSIDSGSVPSGKRGQPGLTIGTEKWAPGLYTLTVVRFLSGDAGTKTVKHQVTIAVE